MDAVISEIKALVTDYGVATSELSINLAIEIYVGLRNYPTIFTMDQRIEDIRKNKAKIAMAVIEIDAKDGVENQLSHSENGISRTYSNRIMAYSDVIGYAVY